MKNGFIRLRPARQWRAGFTLTELLVVVIVLALVATFGMHGHACLMRESRTTACAANLNTMWRMHHVYMVHHAGGCSKSMTHETGGDFWLVLTRTGPPYPVPGGPRYIEPDRMDILRCPRRGGPRRTGTDYRGPATNVNCVDVDVVGSDQDVNHGPWSDFNVLRKSGDLHRVRVSDPLWLQAMRQTAP